jgi:hypothetical protein
MQFDEPYSQESIEMAHLGGSHTYEYTVSYPRLGGTLTWLVCFNARTQELTSGSTEDVPCVRQVRRMSMTPPSPIQRSMLFNT